MNGAQVLEAIRNDPELSALPVVLVTADVRIEVKAGAPGITAALKKPLDLNALIEVVHRHYGDALT